MATLGGVGTYGTVEKSPNYMGASIQNVEENAFKYRQQKALQDEKKAKKEEDDAKDLADHLATYKVNVSGNESIDDLAHGYANDAFNNYAENTRLKNQTTNPRKRQEYDIKNARIDQSFNTLKQIPEIMIAKAKELSDGVKDGKYNPKAVDELQKTMGQIEKGKARVYVDENGQPRFDVYDTDENGKVIGILSKGKSMAELIKSFDAPLASTYDKDIEGITNKYVIDEKVYESGGNKYTSQVKGERENANAKNYADAVLSQPHNLYEISNRTGIPQTDTEKLREYVETDFKNRIAEKKKQEHDYAYDNLQLAKDEAARKNSKEDKEAKEEIPVATNVSDVDFIEDIHKVYRKDGTDKKGEPTRSVTIDKSGLLPNGYVFKKGIDISNVGGEKNDLNNLNVKAVFLDKNNNIIYTGTVLDTKSSTQTVTKEKDADGKTVDKYSFSPSYKRISRVASGETSAAIAGKFGFNSVEELKQHLKDKNTEKDTSTVVKGQVVNGYVFQGGDPNNANNWKKQ